MSSKPLIEFCCFEVDYDRNDYELTRKCLELGFKIEKKDQSLLCEMRKPSKDKIDTFLSLLKTPEESEDFSKKDDTSLTDSFVYIRKGESEQSHEPLPGQFLMAPQGNEIRDSVLHQENENVQGKEAEKEAEGFFLNENDRSQSSEISNPDRKIGKIDKLQKKDIRNPKSDSSQMDTETTALQDECYPENDLQHKNTEVNNVSLVCEVEDDDNRTKTDGHEISGQSGVKCCEQFDEGQRGEQLQVAPSLNDGVNSEISEGINEQCGSVHSSPQNQETESSTNVKASGTDKLIQKQKSTTASKYDEEDERQGVEQTYGERKENRSHLQTENVSLSSRSNVEKKSKGQGESDEEFVVCVDPEDGHGSQQKQGEEREKRLDVHRNNDVLKSGEIMKAKRQSITDNDNDDDVDNDDDDDNDDGDSDDEGDTHRPHRQGPGMEGGNENTPGHQRRDDRQDEKDNDGSDADEAKLTKILFNEIEHRLALEWFADTKSFVYVKAGQTEGSLVIIAVDDQDCVKDLIDFKKQKIQRADISKDKYGLKKVREKWCSKILLENLDDSVVLTAPSQIIHDIKVEFPELFGKEKLQLSPSEPEQEGEDSRSEKGDIMASGRRGATRKMGKTNQIVTDAKRPIRDKKNQYMKKTDEDERNGTFEGHHSKLVVSVHKGNITELPVDVIVNAATTRLNCTGGVAKVIDQAAGKKLRDECEKFIRQKGGVGIGCHFASSGGNLQAKKVYHAVGPKYSSYQNRPADCKKELRLTILRCLFHAEFDGYHSIAFPSISAAISGVPQEIYVESYMKAVLHFEELLILGRSKPSLEEVHFVDIDETRVKAIKQYFEMNWNKPLEKDNRDLLLDDIAIKRFITQMKRESKGDTPTYADATKQVGASQSGNPRSQPGYPTSQPGYPASQPGYHTSQPGSRTKGGSDYSHTATDDLRQRCIVCHRQVGEKDFEWLLCCKDVLCLNCEVNCPKCPNYYVERGILFGEMPPGSMLVQIKEDDRLGRYFEIEYKFFSYSCSGYKSYLPYSDEAVNIVILLLLAFRRKLTFKVHKIKSNGSEFTLMENDIYHTSSSKPESRTQLPDSNRLSMIASQLKCKGVHFENTNDDELHLFPKWMQQFKQKGYVYLTSP